MIDAVKVMQQTAERFESRAVMDSPRKFLQMVGANAASIKATDIQHGRYQAGELEKLIEAYKTGGHVQPVEIFLDEAKNIIGAEGRHRALAAAAAGVEKFPIVIRRRVAEGVKLAEKVMKSGEGAAIGRAGVAEAPAVLRATARIIKSAL